MRLSAAVFLLACTLPSLVLADAKADLARAFDKLLATELSRPKDADDT